MRSAYRARPGESRRLCHTLLATLLPPVVLVGRVATLLYAVRSRKVLVEGIRVNMGIAIPMPGPPPRAVILALDVGQKTTRLIAGSSRYLIGRRHASRIAPASVNAHWVR